MLQAVENENDGENKNENGSADELWVENKNGSELWFAISAASMSFRSRTRTAVSFGSRSRQCFRRRDLAGAGVRRDRCDLGLGAMVQSLLAISLSLSLSLDSGRLKISVISLKVK